MRSRPAVGPFAHQPEACSVDLSGRHRAIARTAAHSTVIKVPYYLLLYYTRTRAANLDKGGRSDGEFHGATLIEPIRLLRSPRAACSFNPRSPLCCGALQW